MNRANGSIASSRQRTSTQSGTAERVTSTSPRYGDLAAPRQPASARGTFMSKGRSSRTKALALTAAVAFIAAQAAASPSDIMIGSAPKVGAEAPKAQDIPDG